MEYPVDDLATFHPDLVGQCLEQGLDRCRRSFRDCFGDTITQSQREVEDDGDQRDLVLVDSQSTPSLESAGSIAKRFMTPAPAFLRGFAFHTGDHPVDDGGRFPLTD
jgi:hypothetical protein